LEDIQICHLKKWKGGENSEIQGGKMQL